MGVPVAQFLVLVRGEIDNRDPPAGPGDARGLGQRGGRLLREMEHLVQQHRVEAVRGERQRGEIALHQLDRVGRQRLQLGARDAQHVEALVERDDPLGAVGEQLRHPPRPGTDIEHFAQLFVAQRGQQVLLDQLVWAVQLAQLVPLFGMAGEIGLGAGFARGADRGELAPVFGTSCGEILVLGLGGRQHPRDRFADRRAAFAPDPGAQEHPGPLAVTLGEARIAQYADMARNARLALPQHLRQFANGKLHSRQQPHDPQPGRVGKRPHDRLDPHGEWDIKIFLYVQALFEIGAIAPHRYAHAGTEKTPMQYVQFGNTGLTVSRLCLGCMSFGDAAREGHDWAMDLDASRPMIRQALEAGINFFDTANAYSGGTSEEFTGQLLNEMARRDEIVIATKGFFRWRAAPNTGGLSAKALMHAVDDSLRRLGTDYIDLYQIHRLDPLTPMEEIVETLDAIVRSGKVRYVGASSMYAWQFQKLLHIAERAGLKKFVSMQNYVNLLYREEEREMLPLCADAGIAVMPWSPLARGRLARSWDATTERSESDMVGRMLYARTQENDREIVGAVEELARARGLPMAQIALAWLLHKPEVTSPIIGATSPRHIEDAVAALDVSLSEGEVAALEAPYAPHPVTGLFAMPPADLKVSVRD